MKLDGTYTITDKGRLSNETGVHEIPFTGTIPTGGYLTYENNILKTGCITMEEYKVNIESGEIVAVEKGECTSSVVSNFGGEVITNIPANGHTGVKAIVYLDPTDITTECNEEITKQNVNEDGSPTGIKSGCMKWYAFEEDDTTYTMILDHNTTAKVSWITKEDYEQTGSQTTTPTDVGIEYLNGLPVGAWAFFGTNNRGPITLLNQLKTDTLNWVVGETLTENDKYIAEWAGSNDYYNGNQQYTINYNGYKARLVSAEEIDRITEKETDAVPDIQGGYLDSSCSSNCSAGMNKYAWLFDYTGVCVPVGTTGAPDCTQYGCNNGNYFDAYYWTSSVSDEGSGLAWHVSFDGKLITSNVPNNSGSGVRPVIKVSKSKLSK